jgi:hypothetical protein
VDDPETAFEILKEGLTKYYLQEAALPAPEIETPAIATTTK